MEREILLLGNERLYNICTPIDPSRIGGYVDVVTDLHDTLMACRAGHGAGRAIAAPQIGENVRMIYMNTGTPIVFINPKLTFPDKVMMEVMDDCMSFPGLYVKVRRHKRCTVTFLDMDGRQRWIDYEDDLAELIQHEYDHLDGVLATMRAIDNKSLFYRP